MWTSLALSLVSIVSVPGAGQLGLVEWFPGRYSSAHHRARSGGQWMFVAFWTRDSPWCQRLIEDSFSDPAVATRLESMMCLNVDLTRDGAGRLLDPRAAEYTERFPVAILPSLFLVSPEGVLEDVLTGYIPPTPLLAELDRIQKGDRTLSGLRAEVELDGRDIAARLRLAQKYEDLGDLAARDAQLAAVRELDPKEVSLPVRRRKMSIVRDLMTAEFDDASGRYDTTPLEEFLDEEEHSELLVEGWAYLAEFYPRIGREKDGWTALARLWPHVVEADRLDYGGRIVGALWAQREKLGPKERQFALEVALRTADLAEGTLEEGPELAAYLDSLACCYYLNGKRQAALRTIDRCIAMVPDEAGYPVRREVFKRQK